MPAIIYNNINMESKCIELQYTVDILRSRIKNLEQVVEELKCHADNLQFNLNRSKACILEMI